MSSRVHPDRPVLIWLGTIIAWVMMMVMVGGVTRLTGSGLSIVDWAPIMGAIPPLDEEQWLKAFAQYQQSPQFQLINSGMDLAGFKFIYFWEYFHRLLGRMLGVVFILPWMYFWAKGRISSGMAAKLLLGFVLGGLQGALGWFMVKSGLIDKPYVSHYRLAAHLSLAVLVLGYLYWLWLSIARDRAPGASYFKMDQFLGRSYRRWVQAFTALICLQIIYGAFVAGLKAGYGYNTFPLMMGHVVPPEAFSFSPFARNLVENPAMVQFVHRSLGWAVLLSTLALAKWTYSRERLLGPDVRRAGFRLAGWVGIQFVLGVLTLLFAVPVSLGVAHQLCACFVLLAALRLNFETGRALAA